MPLAAIYARYSSDLQRATSIEDQIGVARAYAAQQRWTVDESRVYSDAGISGSSIEGRPGLQALLAAAAQRPLPFEVLLVDDSSRIARDMADAIRTMQTLRFFGVRVVYISQGIDSANEQAETLVAMHGMVDSLYLREMSKKIRRGLAGQHTRGFATGSITFGYRTVPVPDPSGKLGPDGHPLLLGKKVAIVPEEADIVRRIFEWSAGGVGVETIVRRLREEGCRGPRGQRWLAGSIRTALINEKYRGLLIWGKRRSELRPGTRQRVVRTLPRDQWHVQEQPELRIISDELWARVQTRRAAIREAFHMRPGDTLVRGKHAALFSKHLFSGFMRCGICGGSVGSVSGGGGSPRYGCTRASRNGRGACANRLTVRAKIVDPALLAGLRAELLRDETIAYVTEQLAAQLNAVIDRRPAMRAGAEDALRDARRRLEHLIAAIEGGAGTSSVLEAIRGRERDIERLQGELEGLDEPLEQKLAVMPGWVRRQVEDLVGLLSGAPERVKAAFQRFGVSFTLYPVDDGARGYFRAEGTTAFAHLISGQYSSRPTHDALPPQGVGCRKVTFVVDLPANGPTGRRKRA
ncbi:MAG TPA: recombinase family protein [Vicinamibacterales bacterium]|nr:recombinase family protein [Vicinamibacterales bacterium]